MNVCIGDEVHARCSDGVVYLGTVTQVDDIRKEVEVKFDEGDLLWTRLSDTRLVRKKASSAERCRACLNSNSVCRQSTDELVVCKQCNEAFHPKCHSPTIDIADAGHWFCRFCILSKRTIPNHSLAQKVRRSYPFDLKKLDWDEEHKKNQTEQYCYCGGIGDWNFKMIQCDTCLQWFHEACLAEIKKPILNGDLFYLFKCSICGNGTEIIKRLNMTWSEALHLVIYNLSLITPARFYRLETDIIRYAKSIWNELQVGQLESEAPNWDQKRLKIIDVLQSNKKRFQQYEKNGMALKLWGLVDPDQPPKPRGKSLHSGTKLTSFSMSDDIGNIKLKITRSPSEASKRIYEPSEPSEDEDVFLPDYRSLNTPGTEGFPQRAKLRKMDSTKSSFKSSSSLQNGSSNSTPSYKSTKKLGKRRYPSGNKPIKKRQNSEFDSSSISSELTNPRNEEVTPAVTRPRTINSRQSFCLNKLVPQRNFFDTEWRMTSGEGFRVMGRRISPDGKISYLIEWEGCNFF